MKDAIKRIHGYFHVIHKRGGEVIDEVTVPNLVVDEGKNHMLDSALGGATQIPTWYIGLFEGDYTPIAGNEGDSFSTVSTEFEDYDEAARPTWEEDGADAKSIGNSANRATFTISTGVADKSIYGLFLVSIATKGADGGTLFSAARFASAKVVNEADELLVSYTVTLP